MFRTTNLHHVLFPLLVASLALTLPTPTANNVHFIIPSNEYDNNPVFSPSTYSNLSEWFTAQGLIYEAANNATRACLAQLDDLDDDSVCFGDDKWDWNPIAYICCIGVMTAPLALAWLVWDWGLLLMLWIVDEDGDAGEEGDPYLICPPVGDGGESGRGQGEERKQSHASTATRVNSVVEEKGSVVVKEFACEARLARSARSSSCPPLCSNLDGKSQ